MENLEHVRIGDVSGVVLIVKVLWNYGIMYYFV